LQSRFVFPHIDPVVSKGTTPDAPEWDGNIYGHMKDEEMATFSQGEMAW